MQLSVLYSLLALTSAFSFDSGPLRPGKLLQPDKAARTHLYKNAPDAQQRLAKALEVNSLKCKIIRLYPDYRRNSYDSKSDELTIHYFYTADLNCGRQDVKVMGIVNKNPELPVVITKFVKDLLNSKENVFLIKPYTVGTEETGTYHVNINSGQFRKETFGKAVESADWLYLGTKKTWALSMYLRKGFKKMYFSMSFPVGVNKESAVIDEEIVDKMKKKWKYLFKDFNAVLCERDIKAVENAKEGWECSGWRSGQKTTGVLE